MRTYTEDSTRTSVKRTLVVLSMATAFLLSVAVAAIAVVTAEDAYEPDNTVAEAKELVLGAAKQQRTLHYDPPNGDVDWVYFEATGGTGYIIQTHDLNPDTTDTVLELYDIDGVTKLAENDDFGFTYASRIAWKAPETGTYYVKVRVRHGGISGHYTLTLREAGAIAGTVTDKSTGVPLEAITVDLWQWDQDGYYVFFETATGADGRYEFDAVPTGTWRVGFYDWTGTYAEQFHNNKSTIESANNVTVSAGTTASLPTAGLVRLIHTIDLQHDAAGVVFDRWVTGYSTAYSGDGYVYGRWTGTELSARFNGTKIRWVGPMQPVYGMADVYIDDVLVAENVDCYAPAAEATLDAVIWESGTLSDGPHTITLKLKGNRNASSTGNTVVLDRFEVDGAAPQGGGTRIDDAAATPGYTGSWISAINPTYYDKTYSYSRWAGHVFSVTFEGTKVAWLGPKTPFYGKAEIWLDGSYVTTVDAYSATQGWRERIWESQTLSPGTHTLEIRPTGEKNPASTSANIVIDAIDVRP